MFIAMSESLCICSFDKNVITSARILGLFNPHAQTNLTIVARWWLVFLSPNSSGVASAS
jgi:hypothetical protein